MILNLQHKVWICDYFNIKSKMHETQAHDQRNAVLTEPKASATLTPR